MDCFNAQANFFSNLVSSIIGIVLCVPAADVKLKLDATAAPPANGVPRLATTPSEDDVDALAREEELALQAEARARDELLQREIAVAKAAKAKQEAEERAAIEAAKAAAAAEAREAAQLIARAKAQEKAQLEEWRQQAAQAKAKAEADAARLKRRSLAAKAKEQAELDQWAQQAAMAKAEAAERLSPRSSVDSGSQPQSPRGSAKGSPDVLSGL